LEIDTYPRANQVTFYAQFDDTVDVNRVSICTTLDHLFRADNEFKEKLQDDELLCALYNKVVNKVNRGRPVTMLDPILKEPNNEKNISIITKGISGRLLFAIKQRRLIAHYYDFMSNNELNFKIGMLPVEN